MKCEECLKVIEEYFDGELDAPQASQTGAHLAKCEACSRAFEALRDEQNLYALYRREVEVSPMLWTKVAARIREAEGARSISPISSWRERLAFLFGTPRLSPALAFALLILAVGATVGLMKYMQSRAPSPQTVSQKPSKASQDSTAKVSNNPAVNEGEEEKSATENQSEQFAVEKDNNGEKPSRDLTVTEKVESRRPVARAVSFTTEESPEQLVREAEQKYKAAIALLARDAKRRRTLLEPDVIARFDQTLAGVDRTITETRRAVRRQPDDPIAVQYMLAAYAKKVEVLREMAAYQADDRSVQ